MPKKTNMQSDEEAKKRENARANYAKNNGVFDDTTGSYKIVKDSGKDTDKNKTSSVPNQIGVWGPVAPASSDKSGKEDKFGVFEIKTFDTPKRNSNSTVKKDDGLSFTPFQFLSPRDEASRRNMRRDENSRVNIPLATSDGKTFGNVSRNAINAIRNGTLNSYVPVSMEEHRSLSRYVTTPMISLETESGQKFGNVSYMAYDAVVNNRLGKYVPYNDEEKESLRKYKDYFYGVAPEKIDGLSSGVAALEKIFETAKKYKDNADWYITQSAIIGKEKGQAAEKAYLDYLKSVGYKSVDDIAKALGEKRTSLKKMEMAQKNVEFSSVSDPLSEGYDKDFNKKSTYNPEKVPFITIGTGSQIYEYINGDDASKAKYAYENEYAIYDEMTDKEVSLYNYYYNEFGKGKAAEYLKTIEEELHRRSAQKSFDKIKGNRLSEMLYIPYSGLNQFVTGVKNAFNTSDDYIPYNTGQILSGMISEDIPDGTAWQVAFDLGTSVFNMAPSIAAGIIHPLAGAALMGVSSAGGTYQESINSGIDKTKARIYSSINGFSEAGLQYLLGGIGKLGGKLSGNALSKIALGIDNAAARFAVEYSGKVASEFFEESLQSVLEPFFENLVLGYAKNENVDWSEVAYSGMLGALTAGFLEGPSVYGQTFGSNSSAKKIGADIRKNGNVSSVLKIVSESPAGSDANNLYTLYKDRGINENNISDLQIGRLQRFAKEDAKTVLNSEKSSDTERLDALSRFSKLSASTNENSVKKDDVYYLIDENFEQNYDKWVSKGKSDGVVLTVGKTSEALKSIGVKEQSVTWDTSNINRSLNEHSYLDDNIMKQIPSLIENPIIVMQSKKSDSRITMFGEVYDRDGLPIMAVLELAPTNRKGTAVLDVIKITSTHSRKSSNPNKPADITQTQSMIDTSDILYIEPNKNRTDNWLVANRLQLPLHITNYGSIKSVTYPDGNVNTYGMQDLQNNESDISTNDDYLTSIADEGVESVKITPDVEAKLRNYEKVLQRFGFRVVYESHRVTPDKTIGYVDFTNKEVYLSPKHIDEALLTHELTHIIDRGFGGKYVENLVSFLKKELSDDWNKKYESVKSKYEKIAEENFGFTYNESALLAETLAEMCSEFTTDEYIKKAADMDVGTIKQIGLMLRYMGYKMKMLFRDESSAHKMKMASLKWQLALYRATKSGEANGSGTLFMYAGEKSKMADKSLLNRAKEMSINGDEPSFIWKETGWRQGTDKKWRYEIDDSKAKLIPVPEGTKSVRLVDVLVHEELYEAYPQLRNIEVEFRDDLRMVEGGWYNPEENLIVLNSKRSQAKIEEDIIHEVQHAVQHVEGFESGGNKESALIRLRKNTIKKLLAGSPYFRKLCKEKKPADVIKYVDNYLCKKYNEKYIEDVAYRAYLGLYGEREARDTSSRKGMQAEERRDNFSEYDKGALLGDEYDEYEIQANTILQKVYPLDMVYEMASLEDGEGNSKERETENRIDTSALEEEISIIDEALADEGLSSADRVALIKDKVRLKRELSGGRDTQGQEDTARTKGLEGAVEAYRESGDTSGIPTRQSVAASKKYYGAKASDIEAELRQIDEALSDSGKLSDMEYDELRNRRDALLTQWREAAKKNSVLSEVSDILDEIDTAARPNHTWVGEISEWLADKKSLIKYGTYNLNDIERNFKMFFGEHFKKAYDKIIQPLYDSKKAYTEGVTEYADRLKKEIVDGLGIKKSSKASAAVMWLGEGQKPISKKAGSDLAPYTYRDCVAEFGAERAKDIKKATEIFRKMYDELLDKVNETRAMLYPNNPDKLIPRREDYFRHFQEMSQGFQGLKNILQTNIGIDPMLVGVSENTKPKSKWQSFAQSRTGNRTEYDAVGGFLDYLPAAMYSTHIDPNIVNVRSLAYDLASAKAEENGGSGNPNANGFIAYLQRYANSLAGKTTSHFDRAVQDSNFGRTAMAIVSWLNNKTKASAVLGNINSVLSQVTNIKNVIGKIEHQSDVVRGAIDALAGLNSSGRVAKRYEDSGFLKERYIDRVFSQFDRGWQKVNPVKWAADVLGYADEIGTRITWNAGYNEAVRKGVSNPVQYADNFTRSCVAGRGIGEEALVFKSQVAKMFLPFRTEVLNDLRVQQDILFGKDDDGKNIAVGKRVKNMMQLYIASMVVNAVIAAIKSDEFEPIEEAREGYEEDGVLGALLSVMEDYADGIGDPVAFDPIYDIASGIYQGMEEGESAGGDVGRAALRTAQNLSGDLVSNNPFSTAVMGMVGFDNDASKLLFNGNVYVPGGMGMPLASNAATVMRELGQGDYASAAAATVKPFLPLGTQADRSAKGLYEWSKGYATTESAYDRMAGQEGDLKYLIEKNPENFIKSLFFGPGAFSGESDAYYNDKTRKFSDEEQEKILSQPDYKSRKVTFDDILAMNKYDSERDERKQSMADEFFRGKEGTILHNLYVSGEDAAIPYKNMAGESSFTDSKTGRQYTLALSASDAEKLTKEVNDKIAERFNRANGSDVFALMSKDEQVKYLEAVANAEYKQAKIKALYENGQMGYEDYFRLESNYIETEAKRDRVLYVDDTSAYVEFNAADTVGQYISYSDVPVSEEGYEQITQWRNYASTRKADDVDRELMRLSNATGSDINVSGNPYGIISYSKNKVEYRIELPDNQIYALCDEVDRAVRSALLALFSKATYKNAIDEVKKDMVASVKRSARDKIKDKYKVKYKSVRVDEFDKIINMK